MPPVPLLRHVRTVKRRLWKLNLLKTTLFGTAGGVVAACIWGTAGRLFPIEHYRAYCLLLVAAGSIAGFGCAFFRRVTDREAARRMDRNGLEERIVTAYDHLGRDDPVALLQREDAERHAESFARDIRNRLPAPPWKSWAVSLGAGCLVLTALLLWPNPMDSVVAAYRAERQWIAEQSRNVEELKKRAETETLPPGETAKLDKELDELRAELMRSGSAPVALDAMERAMERLERLGNEWEKLDRQAEQWAEQWRQHPALREIGQSLLRTDAGSLRESLEHLAAQLAEMTPQQKEALAQALERLSDSAPAADDETRQKLERALRDMAAAARGAGTQQDGWSDEMINRLNESLIETMSGWQQWNRLAERATDLGAAVAQMGLTMAQRLAAQNAAGAQLSAAWAPGGLAESLLASAEQAPPATAEGGSQQGSVGAGAGQNRTPASGAGGSGTGSASGAGTGEAGGTGGTGSGQGSGKGVSQGSGTGGGGSGARNDGGGTGGLQGGFGVGSRKLVTPSPSLAGGGVPQSDPGPVQGGVDAAPAGPAPAADGVARPYEEVYAEYAAEAVRSLDRTPLPQSVQQLVRDYFTEIDPNR